MTEWRDVAFRDLLSEPLRNGVYKAKQFHGRGVKVVNMKELFAHDRISSQPDLRVELTPAEMTRFVLRDGDLLFARRSFVLEGSGKCSLIVSPPEETTFESSMIRARVDSGTADPVWLYYFFRSPQGRALMASIATRTAVSGITGTGLAALRMQVPDLAAQHRIAGILGTLDEFIENNRRRVEVLETMARDIYREWFVHFRFPGHENVNLVDSALGPIPDGWMLGILGDFAEEIRDSVPPSEATAVLPYVPIDEIDRRSVTLKRSRPGDEAASSLRLFNAGDVLFGAMRAYFHKVCLAPFDGVTRSTCFVLRPRADRYHFAVMTLADDATVSYAASHSSGSTIPYAKWANVLSDMAVASPPADLAGLFGDAVSPLLADAGVLADQSNRLACVRDLLLPKLVTGQIDVSSLNLDSPAEGAVA